jgi:hypothetical protein
VKQEKALNREAKRKKRGQRAESGPEVEARRKKRRQRRKQARARRAEELKSLDLKNQGNDSGSGGGGAGSVKVHSPEMKKALAVVGGTEEDGILQLKCTECGVAVAVDDVDTHSRQCSASSEAARLLMGESWEVMCEGTCVTHSPFECAFLSTNIRVILHANPACSSCMLILHAPLLLR